MIGFGQDGDDPNGNDFADTDKQRDTLEKETFKGIMRILRDHSVKQPIVFVIKNVAAFNHSALNDLIHLMKKHRQVLNPENNNIYGHFCLVLGVQSTSGTDDLFVRITI